MSAFLELSDAIHFYILSFCDADALFQCSHVKRSWYIYLEGEEPWKTLSYYNMCRALFSLYSIRSLPLLSPQNNNNNKNKKIDKNKNSADFDPFDFSYDFSGTYERRQQQQQEEEDRARHAYHSVFYLHENSDKDDEQSTIFHYINVSAPYYNDPSHSPAEGYPRLVCPVPPRASSASTGRDFSWDTLYRQDGGSGGAREFYMRFLRHLKFNILFSNAAKGRRDL
ncbi:hypothetical protein ADEAN_000738100 [Angomonas deanei]|uniref:F-box domain containing protein n=1 Tax=Angomonas deanei TaxID=59799 RepID=A0A7G2CJ41_9TRYP|nr:hypothetical protein ADEAN_000738100 [Angomonas deanei]